MTDPLIRPPHLVERCSVTYPLWLDVTLTRAQCERMDLGMHLLEAGHDSSMIVYDSFDLRSLSRLGTDDYSSSRSLVMALHDSSDNRTEFR